VQSTKSDLLVSNHGTIFLLRALTPAGEEWVAEHFPADAMTFGDSMVVEHRYIGDIVDSAVNDGLTVE